MMCACADASYVLGERRPARPLGSRLHGSRIGLGDIAFQFPIEGDHVTHIVEDLGPVAITIAYARAHVIVGSSEQQHGTLHMMLPPLRIEAQLFGQPLCIDDMAGACIVGGQHEPQPLFGIGHRAPP